VGGSGSIGGARRYGRDHANALTHDLDRLIVHEAVWRTNGER